MRGGSPYFVLVLLAALFPPALAQGSEAAWSVEDDADDQAVEGGFLPTPPGGLTWPASGATSHGDLKRVTIEGETAQGFYVNFFVGPFKVQEDPSFSFSFQCERFGGSSGGSDGLEALSRAQYELLFEVPGAPVTYALRANLIGGWTQDEPTSVFTVSSSYAYLCLDPKPEADGSSRLQAADVTLDEATSAIRVWVPKDSLLGVGDNPTPFSFFGRDDEDLGIQLNAGDRLTKIQVASYAYLPFVEDLAPYASDRAPEEGEAPDYVLKHPAANQRVAVEVGDEGGLQSVIAGANQSVPFVLVNKGDSKRIVKLEYALEGAKTASYVVTGPATATVAASGRANLTLALNVPAGAVDADEVDLVIRAQAVGIADDVGHASARLVPTVALGPDANVLYFHGRAWENGGLLDPVLCTALPFACLETFLSPLAEDPTASDPDHAFMLLVPTEQGDTFESSWWAELERATPAPMAFGADPALVDIRLRAPSDVEDVRLHMMVVYDTEGQGEGMLAEATQTATVGSGGTTFSFSVPHQLTDPSGLLPAGTRFALLFEVSVPASQGALVSEPSGGLEIVGRETKITFPLIELPADQRIDAVASPFQIFSSEDRHGFVNPGEARLYNVSLLNQDDEPQDAHLSLNLTPSAWRAELLPGDAYRLQPGDTVRLGVLLHAPADAKEGEASVVWVNVTSATGRPVALRLTAVATSGIDLPDDAAAFKADDEAKSRLLSDGDGKTPGPGALAFLAALALAVAVRRRRAT